MAIFRLGSKIRELFGSAAIEGLFPDIARRKLIAMKALPSCSPMS